MEHKSVQDQCSRLLIAMDVITPVESSGRPNSASRIVPRVGFPIALGESSSFRALSYVTQNLASANSHPVLVAVETNNEPRIRLPARQDWLCGVTQMHYSSYDRGFETDART